MSMKIDWVIACNAVTTHDQLADIQGAGVDHLGILQFPAEHTFRLAVRAKGLPDKGKQYDLTISMLNEQGDQVGAPVTGGVSFVDRTPGDPPDFEVGDIVAVDLPVHLERPGIYTISAWIDGNPYKLPIVVVQRR